MFAADEEEDDVVVVVVVEVDVATESWSRFRWA